MFISYKIHRNILVLWKILSQVFTKNPSFKRSFVLLFCPSWSCTIICKLNKFLYSEVNLLILKFSVRLFTFSHSIIIKSFITNTTGATTYLLSLGLTFRGPIPYTTFFAFNLFHLPPHLRSSLIFLPSWIFC